MNPFAYLTDQEIRSLGYGSRAEFDDAVTRLADLQGMDELMKYESRFLKKQTLDSIFADAGKPAPKFQLSPPPTINTRGEVIPAVVPPPRPPPKPPAPLPTPRFPDTTQEDLRKAELEAQRKREEAALKEGQALSEEEKKRVAAGIAAFSETPRTFEAAPAWSPLEKVVAPALRLIGMETTAEALKPQPLMTPEQLQEYEQGILDRKAAGKAAFEDYFNQNEKFLDSIGFTKENWLKQTAAKTNDYRSFEQPDDSLFSVKTVSDFIIREATGDTGWTPEYKEQYDRYMANVKPEFDPDVGLVGLLYGRRAGGIYETPLTATLRGLVLPESVVGGLTSNYEGNFDERIAEKLRQGKGLESAAQDLVRMAGAEPGGFVDDAAWWLGLGTSFLLPIDLGATSAITKVGGKAADALLSVQKAAKVESKIGAIKAMLGSTDEVRDALKQGLADGVDLRTLVVSNADLIPEVNKVSKTIANFDPNIIPDKAGRDIVEQTLKKALGDDYDNFVQEGKRLGLDEFVPATERGVWEQRPTSVLPVGDSKLAWTTFRQAMIDKTKTAFGLDPLLVDVPPELLTATISREIAKLRLDRALAQGALPAPEMALITPTLAMAKSEIPKFLQKLRQNPAMQKLSVIANDETPYMTKPEILDFLVGIGDDARQALKGTVLYPIIEKAKGLQSLETAKIPVNEISMTRGEFNTIVDRLTTYLAKDEPSALTIQQLSTIARSAKRQVESPFLISKPGQPAVSKFNKLNAATTQIRIAQVFKPQMVRPTGFLKIWNDNISPAIQVYSPEFLRPKILSPEKAFAETTINSKLASVPDEYKATYNAAIQAGESHEVAFAEAILKPFGNKVTGLMNEEDLFANFFASYYGGYDTIVDFASLRTGISPEKLVPKQQLITVFSEAYRNASRANFGYEAGDAMILAIARNVAEQTEPQGIIKALTAGAKLMEGRPLGTFLSGLEPNLAKKLEDLVPQFSEKNIHIPLFATHIQKSQSNIVDDVIRQQLIPTQALNTRGNMQGLIRQSSDIVSNNISSVYGRYFGPTNLAFFRNIEQQIPKYVRDSISNAIITSNNPKFARNKKHVFEFIQAAVLDIRKAEPIGDMSRAEAVVRFVDDMFEALGYKWERPPLGVKIKDGKKQYKVVDIEMEYTDLADAFLARKSAPQGIVEISKTIGDDAVDILIGSVSPSLTSIEVKAWLQNLSNFVETGKKAAKGGFRADPAIEALDVSGLYNVTEMQRAVQNSVNLKKVEEAFTAYDYLKDSRMFGTISPALRDQMSAILADNTLGFADAIKAATEKITVAETRTDKINLIMQQTATGVSEFAFYQVPSFIKQNLLGGGLLPLPVYHMQNYLSGPLLLALTLNRSDELHKIPVVGFLSDFWIGKNKTFTTPSGRVYGYADITDIAERNGLATATYNMAEINKNLLADMIRYAGETEGGIFGGRQKAKTFLGSVSKSIGLQGLSPWMQIAQNMDMAYRRKALVLALKAGETEEQAVETARKALFDYNDLTAFERNWVAKYVWFYRFMRQNIVQTTVQFLDNPGKVARMAKLSKINFSKLLQAGAGEDGEVHDDLSSYKDNRSFISLIEGMDKERLALYTPAIPILDATSQLINAMGLFVWAGSKVGLTELDSLSSDKLLEKGIQSLSLQPAAAMLQLGLQRQFGVNVPVEGIKQNAYLDPRFVAWMKATGTWDTMLAHINVEMTTTPREGLTTFDGYYYKISEDSKTKWALFMDALKVVGLQRSARDYATVLQFIGPEGMEAGTDITTGNLMLDALKFGGLINISSEQTLQQAEQNVRREVISTLEGKKK